VINPVRSRVLLAVLALAALLAVTGPVDVPSLGTKVNAANVVAYTTNTAYSKISDPTLRKQVLGDTAKAALDRFIDGAGSDQAAVRSLATAVAQGHLQFHTTDRDTQDAFAEAHVAGALIPADFDYLSVSETNAAANKADVYADRSVHYVVHLAAAGRATAHLDVRLTNHTPLSGQPDYVIGPFPGSSKRGELVEYLSTYCGAGCELRRHTVDGAATPVGASRELDHRVFSEFVHVPSATAATLGYDLDTSGVWVGDSLQGTYELTFQAQPSLVRPTTLFVEILSPPGTTISRSSVPMQVHGNVAVWNGRPGKLAVLQVEFQKPVLVRALSRFLRFLTKPLF
jgi:hypothetical protein